MKLRFWSGGRKVALKIVLVFALVHAAWDLLVPHILLQGLTETESDLIGLFISAVVVYNLLVHGLGTILFPQGAIGFGSAAPEPAADEDGHAGFSEPDSRAEPAPAGAIAEPADAPSTSLQEPASVCESAETRPAPIRPGPHSLPALIVDDDPQFLFSAATTLRSCGIKLVDTISDSRDVMSHLALHDVSLVLVDLNMPFVSGKEILLNIREEYPHLPVIIITGMMDVQLAVDCVKAGAFDYLIKPVEISRFISSVKRAMELQNLRHQVSSFQEQILVAPSDSECAAYGIVTRSRKMRDVFRYLRAVAPSGEPVLVTGETGVGKELIARAIHAMSGRTGECVAVNVAGLDDAMVSDTLFGHRKGAYTGADRPREGLIARAAGGTLFLDEIGDLQESTQIKLLRLLEEKEYYPLGSDTPKKTDARILCATHRDLGERVAQGTFRKDLYYRLSAHRILIPPLRDRLEDIPVLADHFLEEAACAGKKKKPTPPPELLTVLSVYQFPGNVRELRTMIFDAVIRHRSGVMSLDSFRKIIGDVGPAESDEKAPTAAPGAAASLLGGARLPTLKEAEEFLIAEALSRSRNNQGVAATLLGISRSALNKRLTRKDRSAWRGTGEPDGPPSYRN